MGRGAEPLTAHETAGPDEPSADLLAQSVRFQEAFEFAPDCQLVTNPVGLILEANHAAVALIDHRKEFLIGKPLPLFAAEGSRSRFYECIWRLDQGAPNDAFESRVVRRGDGPRDVHAVARAGERRPGSRTPAMIHWIIRDVTEWRRSEATRAELQRRLTTAQEDERQRVARDLHDGTGQMLTALSLGLRAVRDAGPLTQEAHARLDHVQHLIDELARQVHDLATALRPAALDDLGLEAATRQFVVNWSKRAKVPTDFQIIGPHGRRFPPEIETVLFRVVQEGLTNVAKHAGAGRVAVMIGSTAENAVAVVEDDGTGFDMEGVAKMLLPGEAPTGHVQLGILGMRERVALVGGTLEIETTPGRGTTVIARLPLQP
ncbi:Oxygen sensor histidine kinase NreB [Gemmata sp. SH-PL17]|uniref:PAS domain-containing sensor histidine kinase n=1 Tax=Gemmata sp. SH-PL17 TaxID=1630693 RepID=UPI00078B9C53|nr:PAS domain-containing sensor histidine kinase [Gemmata sp. SH-PL17]AMV23328.1 Oxygen sensor histidine kinase NreB [Gemmata sp. SH-PL17]